MDKSVNLASLPRPEMLRRAFCAGKEILANEKVISEALQDLRTAWINRHMPNACGQTDEVFSDLVCEVCDQFDAGVDEAVKAAQAETPSTPNSRDGEMAAGEALLIVRALQWLHNNVDVDTGREDVDGYQTLVELSLSALGQQIEAAERALSVCRSEQAAA